MCVSGFCSVAGLPFPETSELEGNCETIHPGSVPKGSQAGSRAQQMLTVQAPSPRCLGLYPMRLRARTVAAADLAALIHQGIFPNVSPPEAASWVGSTCSISPDGWKGSQVALVVTAASSCPQIPGPVVHAYTFLLGKAEPLVCYTPSPSSPKSSTSERGQDIFAFSVLWALKCLLN